MLNSERRCPKCERVYERQDWAETDCPFCNVLLEPLRGTNANLLADVVSVELEWPPGQARTQVFIASGYMEAQIVKAQLESAGVPVYLAGESAAAIYGLTVGPMAQVRVYVPQNLAQEATEIINS